MSSPRTRLTVAVFCAAVFLSAALLFAVQPMAAKMLLPLFGGAPNVWNTCLLFYQAVLLLGYLYAHGVARRLSPRAQAAVHLVLLAVVTAFLLPIEVSRELDGAIVSSPLSALLSRLLVHVGLPFFVLAGTGTLLQAWFARTSHPDAGDPYFLYAAGNLGSMLALIAYPTVLEPSLGVAEQSRLWALGFGGLGLLIAGAAATMQTGDAAVTAKPTAAEPLTSRRRAGWLLNAFIPCAVMMGVTLYLTTDIAPVPMLWVLPLGLYLLGFIVAFARVPEGVLAAAGALMAVAVAGALAHLITEQELPTWGALSLHCGACFLVAVVFHGRLATDRPPTAHLTEFYLWISAGGALGGVANALLAPVLFDSLIEYPLWLILALAAVISPWRHAGPTRSLALAVVLCLVLVESRRDDDRDRGVIFRHRSFFGVLTVADDADGECRHLLNGTTPHGRQFRDPVRALEALSYYHRRGPIGDVFTHFSGPLAKPEVGLVGLGAGALAAYGEPGQRVTFYELDPHVADVASDPTLFTYLEDCKAHLEIVLGDARLRLADARDAQYGILVIDAFSSDAIPMHLITREAVALYLSKLAPDGILAIHISNRYLRLRGVVARLAEDAGLHLRRQQIKVKDGCRESYMEWVIMARDLAHFGSLLESDWWEEVPVDDTVRLWTDDFSDIAGVMRWTGTW